MNKAIQNIVNEIDDKLKCVEINLKDGEWREEIPNEPGWYLIKTNTPIDQLEKLKRPPGFEAHTNIPETIGKTLMLEKAGIAIVQSNDEDYVVYNGEADKLKNRAREHVRGHAKTYCLGLSNYREELSEYRWVFCFVAASNCENIPKNISHEDKLLRLAVEQAWRAKHGWPILCKK